MALLAICHKSYCKRLSIKIKRQLNFAPYALAKQK